MASRISSISSVFEPEPRRDPGCDLAHPRRVAAGVLVARVDRLRQACSCPVAGRAVGAGADALELREVDDVRPVDADLILAVLLRPVERTVRQPNELVPSSALHREVRDPDADGDPAHFVVLEHADAVGDRLRRRQRTTFVDAGEQHGELVTAEAERLAALPQQPAHARENPIAGRMTEAVVDALEIVDVDQAERQPGPNPLGRGQLHLHPLLEVAVVAEPGERIGQRELHRPHFPGARALIQLDRHQRRHEQQPESRSLSPEHDENRRRRRHQQKRGQRRNQITAKNRREVRAVRRRHHGRQQDDVGQVERAGADETEVGVARNDQHHRARSRTTQRVERGVVGDANQRLAPPCLDEQHRHQADERRQLPRIHNCRRDDEDRRERRRSRGDADDAHRERLGDGRAEQEHARSDKRGRRRPAQLGRSEHGYRRRADDHGRDNQRQSRHGRERQPHVPNNQQRGIHHGFQTPKRRTASMSTDHRLNIPHIGDPTVWIAKRVA